MKNMNLLFIIPALVVVVIEGLVYKFVIYDELLPLIDKPWDAVLGVAIAFGLIAGDVKLIAELLSRRST